MTHRSLTPSEVMALRTSITYRGSSDSTSPLATPFIVFGLSDARFYLHIGGACMAASADVGVLGACLRAERLEPGFVARILSPLTDAETACLAPADRRERIAARANSAEHARAEAEARALAAQRRRNQIDVSRLDLSDL